jgi:hypothetical protein
VLSTPTPETTSLADLLACEPDERLRELLASYTDAQVYDLLWDWGTWARPNQIPPCGEWLTWLILAGRGFGKLLDNETTIPTPSGWTTMGEVSVGDELFDEAGRVCRVLSKFTPQVEQAYRVVFSDGEELVADAGHQWVTWTRAERKAFLRSSYEEPTKFPRNWPSWRVRRVATRCLPSEDVETGRELVANGLSVRQACLQLSMSRNSFDRHLRAGLYLSRVPVVRKEALGPQIRTTRDILETLIYGKRGDRNHCIPTCGALEQPDADLVVPPYTFGAWLGDGSRVDGTFTSARLALAANG